MSTNKIDWVIIIIIIIIIIMIMSLFSEDYILSKIYLSNIIMVLYNMNISNVKCKHYIQNIHTNNVGSFLCEKSRNYNLKCNDI